MPMKRASNPRSGATRSSNSAVEPLFEIMTTKSPAWHMPKSPWPASVGCRNTAGVPVLCRVAAILRPTWPDLPMPVTTTFPAWPKIKSTALKRLSPRRAEAARTASASVCMALRAAASQCALSSHPNHHMGQTRDGHTTGACRHVQDGARGSQ